jgi:hypothetical protein
MATTRPTSAAAEPAGRGAKVDDGFSGFGSKQTRRDQRGRILQIKRALRQQPLDLRPMTGGHDIKSGPWSRLEKSGRLDLSVRARRAASAGPAGL